MFSAHRTSVILGLLVCTSLVSGLGWYFWPRPTIQLPEGIAPEEYRLAAVAFEQRYHHRPDREETLSWLGESLIQRERTDAALACLSGIAPDHPRLGRNAEYQSAQLALRLNRAAEAERLLRDVIQREEAQPILPPDHLIDARQRLRYLLEVELRMEERHSLLRGVLFRDEADGFEIAAGCFPTLLRWYGTQAADWIEAFAAATPDDRRVRVALGRFRTAQGRLDEARELLAAVRQEAPDDRAALAAWIAFLAEAGDRAALQHQLNDLPLAEADDPWLLQLWRARGQLERHELAEGLQTLLGLVQQIPTHAEAWQEIATAAQRVDAPALRDFAVSRAQRLGSIGNRLGWSVQTRESRPWLEIVSLCQEAQLHDEARHVARFVLRLDPQQRQLETIANTPPERVALPEVPSVLSVRPGQPEMLDATAARGGVPSVPLQFQELSETLGIQFERFDDHRGLRRIHEETGGGAALFDFDRDDRLDLYLTNGCRLPLREATREHVNAFYRQRPDGRFDSIAAPAGVDAAGYFGGVAVGDFNNDGFPDLFVGGYRSVRYWRNQGDGTFADESQRVAPIANLWSTSAAVFDANRDGFLDLFVATYLKADDDPAKLCRDASSPGGIMACPPTHFPAESDVFFLNDGSGGFTDATAEMGLAGIDGKGLGAVAFDVDQDGTSELYVANDGTPCFLYRHAGHGSVQRYEEVGLLQGVALDGEGRATAAMGLAVGDFDRDGWNDLYKTNFYLEPNTLYRNLNGQGFLDVSAITKVGPASRATLGFGCEFFDADNDGWPDLFVANGHIEDRSWSGKEDYRMRPHFFRNQRNGTFIDAAPTMGGYFTTPTLGRGVAVGDINRDGRLDLVVSEQLGRSSVLINQTEHPAEVWQLACHGTAGSNRSAIGTRIIAWDVQPPLMRELVGGGSFQSASSPELHFAGLPTRTARFDVVWPDGTKETTGELVAGRYTLVQGQPPRKLPTDRASAFYKRPSLVKRRWGFR